jgi:hypothetical protein
MRLTALFVGVALVAGPAAASAQHPDASHAGPATAAVDFGVLPAGPLGPPPCLQTGAIGGPADPCAYKIHLLTPDEVAIRKGGEVTFQVHGGGHAMAIYEVSPNTRREDIGPQLCPGLDPATIADPTRHVCNLDPVNAGAQHVVTDGHERVVLVAAPSVTNAHPDNRVWSPEGRLMSAGGHQFLNGGTVPAGPGSNGQLVTYRFLKSGRYLVICMNRTHFLNDWMFGFVDVQGGEN